MSPTMQEVTCRKAGSCVFYFVINFTDEVLEVPESFADNVDVLTGKMVESGEKMAKFDVKIVKVDK